MNGSASVLDEFWAGRDARSARVRRGVRVEELAEHLGRSPRAVRALERRDRLSREDLEAYFFALARSRPSEPGDDIEANDE